MKAMKNELFYIPVCAFAIGATIGAALWLLSPVPTRTQPDIAFTNQLIGLKRGDFIEDMWTHEIACVSWVQKNSHGYDIWLAISPRSDPNGVSTEYLAKIPVRRHIIRQNDAEWRDTAFRYLVQPPVWPDRSSFLNP